MYKKLMGDFVLEYINKNNGTYASPMEVMDTLAPVVKMLYRYPDATPEEMVEAVLSDNIEVLNQFMISNPVLPGYIMGVNANDIDVQLTGGYKEGNIIMPENALFDLASITKFYTQIVAYNLMNEGAFSFEDSISDLDPRFKNLKNVTVGDIVRFGVAFNTPGRIDDKENKKAAKECLFNATIKEKDGIQVPIGTYDYNDVGMMVLKEVMEKVTGKSYDELVKQYITSKLGLKDTHLIVPDTKLDLITGTPNAQYGLPNDKKAVVLGGYSGHAGMFSTSSDLKTLGKAATSILLPKKYVSHLWKRGLKSNRGLMGNTYIPMENGVVDTLVDRLAKKTSFTVQGSTRGFLTAGYDHASTILLNPASISYERAQEVLGSGSKDISKYTINRGFGEMHCTLIDPRKIIPIDNVNPLLSANARLTIRLMFLKKVFEKEHYKEEIKVKKRVE